MSIDHTRKIQRIEIQSDFLRNNRATLVVVSGGPAGAEFDLDRPSLVVGRGPGSDLTFYDDAMSREHAAFEVTNEGFRIRDLGSTNGLSVNGAATQAAVLKHGDRLQIGEHGFQYILEQRQSNRTYVLPED